MQLPWGEALSVGEDPLLSDQRAPTPVHRPGKSADQKQFIKNLHVAQKQWFWKAEQRALKPYFPMPEPNLRLNGRSDFKAATGVMSYINIASMRLFKFNYGFTRFIETREQTDRKHSESRLAPCLQLWKSHLLKEKRKRKRRHHKQHFQRRTRFEPWTEERKKGLCHELWTMLEQFFFRGLQGMCGI